MKLDCCKNHPERLDSDNTINLSRLILSLGRSSSVECCYSYRLHLLRVNFLVPVETEPNNDKLLGTFLYFLRDKGGVKDMSDLESIGVPSILSVIHSVEVLTRMLLTFRFEL